MNFKRNNKKLLNFKIKMNKFSHLEDTDIGSILRWVKQRQKKVKTKSKVIITQGLS